MTDRTPNFDIAATCVVDGRPGMLLVEAKAHDNELIRESAGRKVTSSEPKEEQPRRESSHKTIGAAIDEARAGLTSGTGLNFGISRDTCYQMSNRFASACKLTEMGYAVVLVYLGFLNANEMADQGEPFKMPVQWDSLVKTHSRPLFPVEVWNDKWNIHGRPFVPLIRSVEWEFEQKV